MDFGKILASIKDSISKPSVLGNVIAGKQWNEGIPNFGGVAPQNQFIENPQIASPVPVEDQLTKGLMYKIHQDQDREAMPVDNAPQAGYPKTVQYPEWLANAPAKEVAGAQTIASPTPTPAPTQDLWGRFIDAVNQTAPEQGYDPDTIIKQKALESNFGRSDFAQNRNNFGGIGAYDRNPNSAFSFKDITDYLDYYYKLIQNRYPKAYANRDDPEAYVEGLKEGGYASDPNYVWKVLNTPAYPR